VPISGLKYSSRVLQAHALNTLYLEYQLGFKNNTSCRNFYQSIPDV